MTVSLGQRWNSASKDSYHSQIISQVLILAERESANHNPESLLSARSSLHTPHLPPWNICGEFEILPMWNMSKLDRTCFSQKCHSTYIRFMYIGFAYPLTTSNCFHSTFVIKLVITHCQKLFFFADCWILTFRLDLISKPATSTIQPA